MSPEEYLAQLDALMEVEHWRDALEFSASAISDVHPELSFADLKRVHGAMEVAANIVSFEQAATPEPDRAMA